MKTFRSLLYASTIIALSACQTYTAPQTNAVQQAPPYENLVLHGKMYAAFYQQHAAEYEALCIQAFNIAKLRLDEALSQPSERPLALVSDIDETFLDNSYYAVSQAKANRDYDQKSWSDWTAQGNATPLAGAKNFYQYAADKGVAVFYVTNRYESEREGTFRNLKKEGFPIADPQHLILRTAEGSKENRRQKIAEKYNIVLLLGDNLADLSKDFDKKSEAERSAAVHASSTQFGKKYIVLPNFGYGDWESSFFKYNHQLSAPQKDSLIYNAVKAQP